MLNIGDKIRDYKIVSKIGEGGMGAVFLAYDEILDRKVALKVLNPFLTQNEQFVERFKLEAKVQASLNHKNIVTLHSFIQEDSRYFIAMEYVNGKTIKEILRDKGAFSEQKAKEYFLQILDAIGFAHSLGIVHRDLKPSNILIDVNDNVKIMDFGIAKILGDKNLTSTGTRMGTIYYMSPEQIKADKNIDQRTDIYSLGIVFYEMLTGRVPFNTETESDFEIMQEIVQGKGIDKGLLKGKVSNLMSKVLLKMTAINKEHRFATCYQITESLNLNIEPELISQQEEQTAQNFYPTRKSTTEGKPFLEKTKYVFPKADFGKRFLAALIDYLILIVLVFISYRIADAIFGLLMLIAGIIVMLMRDGFNKGKGIGKALVKLRIINIDTRKPISKSESFVRRLLDIIFYSIGSGILLIVELIMCNTNRGQRLSDILLKLQVVNESDIEVNEITNEVMPKKN